MDPELVRTINYSQKLLDAATDVVGAAPECVEPNQNWARDPKIVGLTMCRSISNFRAAVLLVQHEQALEAKALVRLLYENLLWLAACENVGSSSCRTCAKTRPSTAPSRRSAPTARERGPDRDRRSTPRRFQPGLSITRGQLRFRHPNPAVQFRGIAHDAPLRLRVGAACPGETPIPCGRRRFAGLVGQPFGQRLRVEDRPQPVVSAAEAPGRNLDLVGGEQAEAGGM